MACYSAVRYSDHVGGASRSPAARAGGTERQTRSSKETIQEAQDTAGRDGYRTEACGGSINEACHTARGRWREADVTWPIRRMGGLYGNTRRQKNLFRHRQADLGTDQSAQPAAQSDLHVRDQPASRQSE